MTYTTDTEIVMLPTKKEIIQRLFEAGHINFNEMWVLLEEEPEVKYVVMPQQPLRWDIPTPFPQPFPWDQGRITISDPCTANPLTNKDERVHY